MARQCGDLKKEYISRLFFNKNCSSGGLINEKILPDAVEATSWTKLFAACIESLLYANHDPSKCAKILNSCAENYTNINVQNQAQLGMLVKKISNAFGMCPNFISASATSCPECNSSSDDDGNDIQESVKVERCWVKLTKMDFSKYLNAASPQVTDTESSVNSEESTENLDHPEPESSSSMSDTPTQQLEQDQNNSDDSSHDDVGGEESASFDDDEIRGRLMINQEKLQKVKRKLIFD